MKRDVGNTQKNKLHNILRTVNNFLFIMRSFVNLLKPSFFIDTLKQIITIKCQTVIN